MNSLLSKTINSTKQWSINVIDIFPYYIFYKNILFIQQMFPSLNLQQ